MFLWSFNKASKRMSYRGSYRGGRGGRGRGRGGASSGRDSPKEKTKDVEPREDVDDQTMGISLYGENAFVVYGEITNSYKDDLYKIGGKYNPKLQGGAGYIFSNKYWEDAVEFVKAVNSGEVEQGDEQGDDQGDEQADESYLEPEPKIVIPKRTVVTPVKTIPTRAAPVPTRVAPARVAPVRTAPVPVRSAPVRAGPVPARQAPTRPTPVPVQTSRPVPVRQTPTRTVPPARSRAAAKPGIALPISAEQANLEVSDNGLSYQTVSWIVEVPTVGTLVCAQLPGANINYKVVGVFGSTDTIDTVFVKELDASADSEPSILQICNGKWQARGMFEDHTIVFGGLCEEVSEEVGEVGESAGGDVGESGGEVGSVEGSENVSEGDQTPTLIAEDGTRE